MTEQLHDVRLRVNGVSRTHTTSGRRSFNVTSAAPQLMDVTGMLPNQDSGASL